MTISLFYGLTISRLCLTVVLCLISAYGFAQPKVVNGKLDAREVDLHSEKISLAGSWTWYDNQLLEPYQLSTGQSEYVNFPQIWNDARKSKSGEGYATYSATILLPTNIDSLAISMPDAYTSYRLWANGKVIAENGTVGKSAATTKPHWEAKAVSFKHNSDTLQLVLQIANYHHAKGGMKGHITLGENKVITSEFELTQMGTVIECISLAVMFLFFFILYLIQGAKKIISYFALLCLTWSIRSVFSNNYVFASYFPDLLQWESMVRIEYFTLYLTMIWSALFVSNLFINEQNKIIKHLLVSFNGVFIVFTAFADPLSFTQWMNIYLIIAGALIIYTAAIIFRGLINERTGSIFLTLGILFSMLLFAYDIFTYEGYFSYHPLILSLGYIIIFIMMALALLFHLKIITGSAEQTTILRYDDLYKDDAYRVK